MSNIPIRQSIRRGRERGCWIYLTAEELRMSGIDPYADRPMYGVVETADREVRVVLDPPFASDATTASVRGLVYYARSLPDGPIQAGLIKIGHSIEPRVRARHLGPVVLLATETGGRRLEQRRHAEFAEARAHGEWFHPSRPLLAHIEGLAA